MLQRQHKGLRPQQALNPVSLPFRLHFGMLTGQQHCEEHGHVMLQLIRVCYEQCMDRDQGICNGQPQLQGCVREAAPPSHDN